MGVCMNDASDGGQDGPVPAAAVLLIIVGLMFEGALWWSYLASSKNTNPVVQSQEAQSEHP